MLLLHLAMVPLLYHVARKLGCGPPPAALAPLLFSLSPLAIFYQRLRPARQHHAVLGRCSASTCCSTAGGGSAAWRSSGVCFGLALLSKETAIFLLPAMLFIA